MDSSGFGLHARPGPASGALLDELKRRGSLGLDDVMRVALYAPQVGFYSAGSGAGRHRDFLTSPEVGPLFGAVVARRLDAEWHRVGRPDPFVVIEGGAGPGGLVRSVLAAEPECASVLRYVLVETAEVQRASQSHRLPLADHTRPLQSPLGGAGPEVRQTSALPEATPVSGVVIANELLDNLPARWIRHVRGEWGERRWSSGGWGGVPTGPALSAALDRLVPAPLAGDELPWQGEASAWVDAAISCLREGTVIVIDYMATSAELATRRSGGWLRTYRSHQRGSDPLETPGARDITVDVASDQLPSGGWVSLQAEWLRRWGIDELVEEGRAVWAARAHQGDLVAIRARSRIHEAQALCDPAGLGAFTVIEWEVGRSGSGFGDLKPE